MPTATTVRKLFPLLGIAAFIALGACCSHSLAWVATAPENDTAFRMAVLKGFHGPVTSLGSTGDFSFFRAGKFRNSHFKVRTSTLRLPSTFPPGAGTPYPVTMGDGGVPHCELARAPKQRLLQ